MNSESNSEESVPIYSEVKSQIIWLQFVTGSRDPFVMAELEQRSTNRRTSSSVSGMFGAPDYRNRLNEGFDGTGPGVRLRYSQLRNCLDGHSIIGNPVGT